MTDEKPAPLQGQLEAFWETGTEGVIWSFYEDSKQGYDGLHCLKKGDLLRVFNDASKKEVIFEGKVDLEYKRRYRPYPMNPQYGQQEVFGMWVHGFQRNADPEAWAKMFFDGKPAELVPATPPKPAQPVAPPVPRVRKQP